MSTLSAIVGTERIVTSLVNGTAEFTNLGSSIAPNANAQTYTGSGSVAANALQTAYSYTGRGQINFAGVWRADTTSRAVRIKVTIDGVAIYDKTSSAVGSGNLGLIAIGGAGSASVAVLQPVKFRTSCLVEISSSQTETGGVTAGVNVEIHA